MKVRNIILLLVVALCCTLAMAKDIKRPTSYNYTRAVELYDQDNYAEATDYLNKELADNPKNGYAHLMLGVIAYDTDHYGDGLTAVNEALKYLNKKDNEFMGHAYLLRASIYAELGEQNPALADFAQALKFNPDNANIYSARAKFYARNKQYDLAVADYLQYNRLNPGQVQGYMGLGYLATEQKRWDEALKHYDYVTKLDPNYYDGFAKRARANMELKKYNEASDDVIASLTKQPNSDAIDVMMQLADSALTPIVVKTRVQAAKEPNNGLWPYCLGGIYETVEQYRKAIKYYEESLTKDNDNELINRRIASCYGQLGDYSNALRYINQIMAQDTTETSVLYTRTNIYEQLGMIDSARVDANTIVTRTPDEVSAYINRGSLEFLDKNYDRAIDDLTTAVTLEPTNMRAQYEMGRVLWQMGRRDEARPYLERVLELDTVPDAPFQHNQYVYTLLGQPDKAREAIDKLMTERSVTKDVAYDYACAYSLLGDTDQAIEWMRKAMSLGFRQFEHINRDPDMDNIRDLQAFKDLMAEYRNIFADELADHSDAGDGYEIRIVEVPFTSEGKLCKVKCTINGLPLHFIFDTGASDVSMSTVEATFMFKNDYLSDRDVTGKANYMTANGEISEGTIVNLREVNFGGLSLTNVKASIVRSQAAPLLLGQSVLGKLGKIEIDNARHVLKITHRVPKGH